MDRLFDDPHAGGLARMSDSEKREVVGLERQGSKRIGSVDAESGSLIPDSKPEHEPHDDVQRAAQDQLPGRPAVRTSTVHKPRADEDVGMAVLHGAEEARDLLRLVIEVRINCDDVIDLRVDGGEALSEGSAKPRGSSSYRMRMFGISPARRSAIATVSSFPSMT